MGYCPRCGENSEYGTGPGASATEHGAWLRIPASSRIVRLDDPEDGSIVSYAGARFRVHRTPEAYVLQLVS